MHLRTTLIGSALLPLANYVEPQVAALEGPAFFIDLLIRYDDLERPRERVGLEPQRVPVFPGGHERRPVEPESLRVGRRLPLLSRLVETHEEREPVAQPQKAQVAVEVPDLLLAHPGPERLLAPGLGLDEPRLGLGPPELSQQLLVVHAAQAGRVGVRGLYEIHARPVSRDLGLDRVVGERVRTAGLLVPVY